MDRRSRILGPAGVTGVGLEIGALHAPILLKPAYEVLYVDYAPTEVLRANQHDPAIDTSKIVEVDIVWGETPLRQAVGHPVDYVVASHVIEHVPDLIGWLQELHDVLRPGGTLALAVPDKRHTFDWLRKESTVAEAVEAHLLGYRRPSLRQVFEAAALCIPSDRRGLGPDAARPETLARLPSALGLAQSLVRRPRYNDAHCWVFTPRSFLDLAEELAHLSLFPFAVAAFQPTEGEAGEFYVRLEAAPADGAAIFSSIAEARAGLEAPAVPAPVVSDEVARLRAELEAIRSSTSWKLTAPLRAAVGALRRPRLDTPERRS